MKNQHAASVVLMVLGAAGLVGTAGAQCQLGYDSRYKSPETGGIGTSCFAEHNDGSGPALYVGGHFYSLNGSFSPSVAKFDGRDYLPLNNGYTNNTGSSAQMRGMLDWDPDGAGPLRSVLLCHGSALDLGSNNPDYVRTWSNEQWSSMNAGLATLSSSREPGVYAVALFDDGNGPKLYVTGDFGLSGTSCSACAHVAVWDGTRWQTVGGNGLSRPGYAMAVHNDGSGDALYVGGAFMTVFNRARTRLVAKWTGTDWTTAAGGIPTPDLEIRELVSFDQDGDGGLPSELFAFGTSNFPSWQEIPQKIEVWKMSGGAWSLVHSSQADGVPAPTVFDDSTGPQLYMALSNASDTTLFRWNGTQFVIHPTTGNPVTAFTLSSYDFGFGKQLVIGGRGVKSLRDGQWSSPLLSTQAPVTSSLLLFDADGDGPENKKIYSTGRLADAPADTEAGLIAFDGENWSAIPGGPPGGNPIAARTNVATPEMYGSWAGTGEPGDPYGRVWTWTEGSTWSFVGDDGFDHYVQWIETVGEAEQATELYVCGNFLHYGTQDVQIVAHWNGAEWTHIANYERLDDTSVVAGFGRIGQDMFVWEAVLGIGGYISTRVSRFDGEAWTTAAGPAGDEWAEFVKHEGDLYAFCGFGLFRWDIPSASWDFVAGYPESTSPYVLTSLGEHDLGAGLRLCVQVRERDFYGVDHADWLGQGFLTTAVYTLDRATGEWTRIHAIGVGTGIIDSARLDGPAASPQVNVLIKTGFMTNAYTVSEEVPATVFVGMPTGRGFIRFGSDAAPEVFEQPIDRTAEVGGRARFVCDARGLEPLTFQWQHNGVNVVNGAGGASSGGGTVFHATGALLLLENVQATDAGTYLCVVTDACGQTVSSTSVSLTIGVACIADFNGVGGVSVQDIFDFLTAWFEGQPGADVNHQGGVSVQDVFDFLTAWFEGC